MKLKNLFVRAAARLLNSVAAPVIAASMLGRPGWIMAEGDDNWGEKFKYIVAAIIVVVLGAVTVSIISGVGIYILGVFNSTAVKIPNVVNYLNPIAPMLGSVFDLLIVVLIIVSLVLVIRSLRKTTEEF